MLLEGQMSLAASKLNAERVYLSFEVDYKSWIKKTSDQKKKLFPHCVLLTLRNFKEGDPACLSACKMVSPCGVNKLLLTSVFV